MLAAELETKINDLLVEASHEIDARELEIVQKAQIQRMETFPVAWAANVARTDYSQEPPKKEGICETIGVYTQDDAASQMFPALAQQQIVKGLEKQAREVSQEIRKLLNRRLSEL